MCSTCLLTNYSSIQELRQGLTAPHKHLTLPHTNMKDFSYMMPHPEEHVLPTYNAQEPRLLLPEYGRMVQASNEALKLLRPFAKILGQTE